MLSCLSPLHFPDAPQTEPVYSSVLESAYSTDCEWHIGTQDHNVCSNSGEYPSGWDNIRDPEVRGLYFFPTAEACCHVTYGDICDVVDVCPTSSGSTVEDTSEANIASSGGCYWHRDIGDRLNTCTKSSEYPELWNRDDLRDDYLFATSEECCDALYIGDCNVVDECTSGSTEGKNPKASRNSTSSDCEWHINVVEHQVCTNSPEYPIEWDTSDNGDEYLFATAEECCETRFPGLECIVVDECTPEFLPLEPDSDLTNLPWDFGNPAQWRIDDTVSISSENMDMLSWDASWLSESKNAEMLSFNPHSITNIPAVGVGATSDLTLKIHIPNKATLRCVALIDVHLPFESFVLVVNGEPRHQYFESIDGWTEILTGLLPGDHMIIFHVENGKFDPGFDHQEDFGDYGNGRVWLDQCQIMSHPSAWTGKKTSSNRLLSSLPEIFPHVC